jgi:acetylornithine aminotransferase/putrescine aminotransferase
MSTTRTSSAEAFDLIARHMSPHKADAYQALGLGVVQGRREGVRIWDLEGRDYINCRSSGGVFNFGHHPQFAVDALTAAVREHDMGDWLLPSVRRARGAAALARRPSTATTGTSGSRWRWTTPSCRTASAR